MRKVYLKVKSISTDPVQYKPYNPTLTGEDLYVAINLSDDMFDKETVVLPAPPNGVVITPAGLAEIMGRIAIAIRSRLTNG